MKVEKEFSHSFEKGLSVIRLISSLALLAAWELENLLLIMATTMVIIMPTTIMNYCSFPIYR
jgi:hypothetical protein